MLNVLITGSSGFVGARLAESLAAEGHRVVGTGRGKAAPEGSHGAYMAADLLSPADCLKICAGIDAIVHCAGKAGAWGPYAEYEKANVTSTANLIKGAKQAGVKRFINISSPSIYFAYKHQLALKESDLPPKFSNAYAATKYVAEEVVAAAHKPNFLTVSLRPRGIIGAGDRNWLPRIIEMRRTGSLIQPGDGKNVVDFTSIGNLLDVIAACLTAPAAAMGATYNISNGTPEYLWDVIDAALAAVGLDGKRKRLPLAVAMAAAHLSEWNGKLRGLKDEPALLPIKVGVAAYSMTMNISAAKTRLGYKPRLTTAQGIEEFAQWWT